MSTLSQIPVLLLKTRSQPHDAYDEYFSTHAWPNGTRDQISFQPEFIPVLQHTRNEETLNGLGKHLKSGKLKEIYGGMIFTSQRAVEGWTDIVWRIEEERMAELNCDGKESGLTKGQSAEASASTNSLHTAIDTRTNSPFTTDILRATPFPLYTVGPATSRALQTLISSTSTPSNKSTSPFQALNPHVYGSHTGNGASLARYILEHYNSLHQIKWYTYHDAPRLPFVPLLGMGSENYSRRRLEPDDPRLDKRPLCFLVGETRRDIIPKTLMMTETETADNDGKSGNENNARARIMVDEIEVYRTDVLQTFRRNLETVLARLTGNSSDEAARLATEATSISAQQRNTTLVIVIFSPQGSEDMLKSIGMLDAEGNLTPKAKNRQHRKPPPSRTESTMLPSSSASNTDNNAKDVQQQNDDDDDDTSNDDKQTDYIIVTIGPTTRDHLRDKFGFEPDVCARKPSPEGVGEGLIEFFELS